MTTKRCNGCEKIKDVSEFSRRGNGYQSICRECFRDYSKDHREAISAQQREWRTKIKRSVIDHYGGQCQCCGESEIAFLVLDHIENNGAEWRKLNKSASLIYWAHKSGHPKGLQVLCANCNMAKHFTPGGCPHRPTGAHDSVHRQKLTEKM